MVKTSGNATKTNTTKKVVLPAIISQGEIISWADAHAVAVKDSNATATDCNAYAEANQFQYYAITNTWLLLIQDVMGSRARFSVQMSIKRDGLIKCIANASALADSLIQYAQNGTPVDLPMGWFMPEIRDMNLADALQCLRYPKRFTPTQADKLLDATYQKFLDVNMRCRRQDFECLPIWLTARVKQYTSQLLKTFTIHLPDCYPRFSSGSTTAGRALIKKIKAYSSEEKYWVDPLYPIGDPREIAAPDPTITIVGVPKNYKGYRLIGPEHPYYAAQKQRIMEAMRLAIADSKYASLYTPRDQSTNQELARQGSIDGSYATIDLTSASDSISERLAWDVLPDDFLEVALKYRVRTVILGGRHYTKRMFATSGDPLCFDTESIIFLSIALTVTDIVEGLTSEKMLSPQVFGDDLIVDTRCFDSMMDILSILGFVPNREKSFGSSGYRESCGVEYYYGYDTSTTYWPRKVVLDPRKDVESLQMMTSLEHRMFHSWDVTEFLISCILACYPKMTASVPGSECDDLWADSPWSPLRCAPVDPDRFKRESVPEEWTRREVHVVFVTEHSPNKTINLDLESYHYAEFLRNGPLYATALDEILRTSEPTARTADFGIPKLAVTRKTM